MAEIARFTIPLADYPSGSQTFGPVSIPSAVRLVEFAVARSTTATPTIWPNASTTLSITVDLEIAGQWVEAASFGAAGGIVSAGPAESAESRVRLNFALPVSPTRARARITVAGGPLRTSGRLVAFD